VQVFTTSALEDPREVRDTYPRLEAIGYDGVFSFEAKHDPFVALAVAAEHTTRVRLGTAIAIAFARTPMNLAYLGYDLQLVTGGRFVLGLGSQVRPHIVHRYGAAWSEPARRMHELVRAVGAVFDTWETGEPLAFEGDFYRHTLMIPAFDPGPNPYGRPPVYVGGFGPRMVEVAGEVADGLITHPFTTRESLETITMPALERGLATASRARTDVQVVCATLVVTSDRADELERLRGVARQQLAFYGSTPAYASTLECHGWADLHPELNRLSKAGRWEDMAGLIDDDVLDAIAVVGEPATIAGKLRARLDGIADAVSLTNNRAPDPDHWAGVVADLKRG
jgi:probable F420-dependent oxidoreductase